MSQSNIVAFFHCKQCIDGGRKDRLDVGLLDEQTLRVWCARCQTTVGDFPLAIPIAPRCDICGQTGPHHH
jgi:hypothetical protein